MRTTLVPTLASLLLAAHGVSADWQLDCNNILVQERSDPIVDPGTVSGHVHNVVGGSNFGPNSTYQSLRASECTSCKVQQDLSSYWHPQLYFEYANGTFESVPLVNQSIMYHHLQNKEDKTNVTIFPPGFQMLTGNMTARSYDAESPMAQAIGWDCLGAEQDAPNNQTLQPGFPSYNCPGGLRGEVMFPSCWNGKDLDSADHSSHMAYPIGGESGRCPSTHPVRLMTLHFQVLYDTNSLNSLRTQAKNASQPFVLAMGDSTGFGWHGDFINGWDLEVLQEAIDTCTGDSMMLSDCAVFKLGEDECRTTTHWDEVVVSSDSKIELLEKLPGNNPVQSGPKNAIITPSGPAKASKSVTVHKSSIPSQGDSMAGMAGM